MKYFRQAPPEDEYVDLRYDPNWRKNLEGAHFLNQLNARLSLDSFEESEDSLEPLENVPLSSRQEYVVVSNPPTVQMDNALSPPPSSPFHLHPQQEDILDPPESVPPWKRSSQHLSNPRPVRAREDIVERNKATLGICTHKQGSYLKVHQQKDKTEETKQVSIFKNVPSGKRIALFLNSLLVFCQASAYVNRNTLN